MTNTPENPTTTAIAWQGLKTAIAQGFETETADRIYSELVTALKTDLQRERNRGETLPVYVDRQTYYAQSARKEGAYARRIWRSDNARVSVDFILSLIDNCVLPPTEKQALKTIMAGQPAETITAKNWVPCIGWSQAPVYTKAHEIADFRVNDIPFNPLVLDSYTMLNAIFTDFVGLNKKSFRTMIAAIEKKAETHAKKNQDGTDSEFVSLALNTAAMLDDMRRTQRATQTDKTDKGYQQIIEAAQGHAHYYQTLKLDGADDVVNYLAAIQKIWPTFVSQLGTQISNTPTLHRRNAKHQTVNTWNSRFSALPLDVQTQIVQSGVVDHQSPAFARRMKQLSPYEKSHSVLTKTRVAQGNPGLIVKTGVALKAAKAVAKKIDPHNPWEKICVAYLLYAIESTDRCQPDLGRHFPVSAIVNAAKATPKARIASRPLQNV